MNINTRVQIPAHTDTWMKGDRFGTVQVVINHPSGTVCRVKMDKSGRSYNFSAKSLTAVEWIG